jgi:hypothetical protein
VSKTLAPKSCCADQLHLFFFFVLVFFEKMDVRSSDYNEDNFAEGEKKKKKKKKKKMSSKKKIQDTRVFVES